MFTLINNLYRFLLLAVLCAIAFYARLIYERMPMMRSAHTLIEDFDCSLT